MDDENLAHLAGKMDEVYLFSKYLIKRMLVNWKHWWYQIINAQIKG